MLILGTQKMYTKNLHLTLQKSTTSSGRLKWNRINIV